TSSRRRGDSVTERPGLVAWKWPYANARSAMNLIVGATGMLGGEICHLLAEQNSALSVLVRNTSNPEKVERLRGLGAEVIRGDLKDRASLETACRGASAVVSTASSTVSSQEGVF